MNYKWKTLLKHLLISVNANFNIKLMVINYEHLYLFVLILLKINTVCSKNRAWQPQFYLLQILSFIVIINKHLCIAILFQSRQMQI